MIYLEECQAKRLAESGPQESIDPLHPAAQDWVRYETRRQFLRRGANVLGMAALAALAGESSAEANPRTAIVAGPHFAPKAKQVIYLHMVVGPSQMDLYDYKPVMQQYHDKALPDSQRLGQRLTTMTSGQARFPIAP